MRQQYDQRRQALGEFLRTRRMKLHPTEVNLPVRRYRRTPGLRREEVAVLANVGVSWYTALEQGRKVHPSATVLESIADALQLTEEERRYLYMLAEQPIPIQIQNERYEEVASPAIRQIVDDLGINPTYVLGKYWDRLYWNQAAEQAFLLSLPAPPHTRNLVWRLFTIPQHRSLYTNWKQIAQQVLADFRADSARYPGEAQFTALIKDLQQASGEFGLWWAQHDVRGDFEVRQEMNHPVVGPLILQLTALRVATDPDMKIMIYTPSTEAETTSKLRHLINSQ
ncbi:helix-turn-helix transcriptional regulator [Dictyobacter aurantiacus]|uniref:Transcriptional regulator n=1 Tax=Dictyobacter aurantiacus TaxID=1936993 RepID=A0A401ZQH3_9CHLR|nr:helix-turn-helix transcriptional regulator [Dictyobacter aurantiacus]GCE09158.1 transcriptional regulator [Dictyobacter aurantiacus]